MYQRYPFLCSPKFSPNWGFGYENMPSGNTAWRRKLTPTIILLKRNIFEVTKFNYKWQIMRFQYTHTAAFIFC
jgi:hypothetical protein